MKAAQTKPIQNVKRSHSLFLSLISVTMEDTYLSLTFIIFTSVWWELLFDARFSTRLTHFHMLCASQSHVTGRFAPVDTRRHKIKGCQTITQDAFSKWVEWQKHLDVSTAQSASGDHFLFVLNSEADQPGKRQTDIFVHCDINQFKKRRKKNPQYSRSLEKRTERRNAAGC